jgi:hypothetical protein
MSDGQLLARGCEGAYVRRVRGAMSGAITEGLVLAEQLDAATEDKIARRFQWAGLLGPAWARDDLARVINGLNQRPHYAVDEYPEPPPPATPG